MKHGSTPPPGFTLLFSFPQWDWNSDKWLQVDVFIKS